jgi:hypothetical protein
VRILSFILRVKSSSITKQSGTARSAGVSLPRRFIVLSKTSFEHYSDECFPLSIVIELSLTKKVALPEGADNIQLQAIINPVFSPIYLD